MSPEHAQAATPTGDRTGGALRRELHLFSMYRLLEALLLVFLAFSPFATGVAAATGDPALAQTIAIGYLLGAIALFFLANSRRAALSTQALIGLAVDIAAATLAIQVFANIATGVSLLLVFNIAAAALFLSLRASLGLALLASVVVSAPRLLVAIGSEDGALALESTMVAVTYLASAVLTSLLGSDTRASQALAIKRGLDLANLSQINELIIRRMRAGVIVVDEGNEVRVLNEAAWFVLGKPGPEQRNLGKLAPELARRLWYWRQRKPFDNAPLALADNGPQVQPRFTRLSSSEGLALVFLQDTSMVSRQAEQLTLTTLGRLSASIAHEIRNPLASISYAAQLLEESPLADTDRRLVEIINTQCQRMNSIVQDILGMARRERAQPDALDLVAWSKRFLAEFNSTRSLGDEQIRVISSVKRLDALVDAGHLQQILTILVNNAIAYGRLPDQPPRIAISVRAGARRAPLIEVIDRGPGIAPKVVASIFEPFFTTSETGTGLGLYIARQLCEANQATLDYESVPGGGSCFRITLAASGDVTQAEPMHIGGASAGS